MSVNEVDVNADVRGFRGPAVDIAAIERELAKLWRMPTVVGLRATDIVPTRTSVLNLVVFATGSKQAARANRIITELATSHPSRAIVVTLESDPASIADDIDAHVSTHCFASSGERFAACFEQVDMRVPIQSLDLVPSIMMALALPDLPTYIWWYGQPPLGDRRFNRIASTSDRLILDSLEFTNCARNLIRVADRCRELDTCCAVSDLNWARLKPWRSMTAQFYDMPDARWAIEHLTHVTLDYGQSPGGSDNPAQALLYVGWLASRLGWQLDGQADDSNPMVFTANGPRGQQVTIELRQQRVSRDFRGELLGATLSAADGQRDLQFAVSRTGENLTAVKMVASSAGQVQLERAMQAAPTSTSKLLVHELQQRLQDQLYQQALQEARHFAARLIKRG